MATRSMKSIKDDYRLQMWAIIGANVVALFVATHYDAYNANGAMGLLPELSRMVPIGLGLVIATVANGVVSADLKARLVFLRWRDVLPGHRAFSVYGPADPRIDMAKIAKLLNDQVPTSPPDQNRAWYKMLKEVDADPPVRQAHRDFLFTRDYATLSTLMIVPFGAVAICTIDMARPLVFYLLFLVFQFVIVRHVASTYGKRLVTTVMAQRSATKK